MIINVLRRFYESLCIWWAKTNGDTEMWRYFVKYQMKMHDNRAIKQCCGKKEWSVKKNFQGISQEVFQQKVYWECVNSLDSLKAKTQHSWIHKSQGSLINSGTKSHFCSVIWQWTLTLMQKFHCFCHSTICCRGSKQLHFNNLLLGIGSTSFSIDWTVLFFAELSTLSLNVISYY